MNSPVLPDFSSVAQQIIKISDFRQKMHFTEDPLVRGKEFSSESARYHSVTAVIATAVEPQKAGSVAKKLLASLDAFQKEKLQNLTPEEATKSREMFVERFLRFEYCK